MNDRVQLHDEHVVWDIARSPRMWNQTLALCKGNEAQCDEVVMDAQIAAVRRYRAGRYDPSEGSLGAWVWEIVKSAWKSSVRKYRRRGSMNSLEAHMDSGGVNAEVGALVFVTPWHPRPFPPPDVAVEMMQRVRKDPKALAALLALVPHVTHAQLVRDLKRIPDENVGEFAAMCADLCGWNQIGWNQVGEDWLYWRNEWKWKADRARDDAQRTKQDPEPGPVTIITGPLPADITNGNLPKRKFKTWEEYDAWVKARHEGADVRAQRFETIAVESGGARKR